MNTKLFLILTFLLPVVLTGFALAEEGSFNCSKEGYQVWGTVNMKPEGDYKKMEVLSRQAEQEEIRKVLTQYSGKIYDFKSRLYAKVAELNSRLLSRELDKDKVNALVTDINELQGKLFSTRVKMLMELKKRDAFYSQYGWSLGICGNPFDLLGGAGGTSGRVWFGK